MQVEGVQGAAGANPADLGELTPPAAVHYFHTMIVPQLGQRLNLRAHREMRTLCTALDLLARKLPAHAADLLGQRLKAIEKSCHDGHWQAAGAGLGRSPAKGRRGVHEQGTPPGAQAEGLQPPERGRGRKRKSREGRPKRERERKRQRRRKGEREEGLADEAVTSGPACPPEPADAGGLKVFRSVERSPVELFGALRRAFESKDTPLCRLAQLGKSRGAPPEDKSSKQVRGDELLPINPQAVLAYLHSSGEMKAQGVAGMVCALNYLAKSQGHGGWVAHVFMKELTQAQKLTVDHLRRALDYVEERKLRCGRSEETARHLAAVRFAYQGVPVVVMEDIRAEKVIAAWPKVGQAAVQDALTFAPEELRAKLLDPVSCLKPVHAWPQEPHKSRVRATDDEWNKDVGAAYERGLMVADELDEGFKDEKGRPLLNGAGAVKKEKKVYRWKGGEHAALY